MKTELPLPNDDQDIVELKKKKLDYKNPNDMQRLGRPFHLASIYHIDLYESDLAYIDRKIKNHKLFRLIISGTSNTMNKIVFFESFAKDPNCPANVQKFLYTYIGALYRILMKYNQDKIFEQRRQIIEDWLIQCR